MDLEGIMLSEITQRKTNTVWSHLYVESEKNKKQKTPNQTQKKRSDLWLPEAEGGGRGN